jgi:hypothetical protein
MDTPRLLKVFEAFDISDVGQHFEREDREGA